MFTATPRMAVGGGVCGIDARQFACGTATLLKCMNPRTAPNKIDRITVAMKQIIVSRFLDANFAIFCELGVIKVLLWFITKLYFAIWLLFI